MKTERVESRKYWSEQVRRWRGSGLTQKAYCEGESISVERLGTWKRRLDREAEGGAIVAVPAGIVSSALFRAHGLGLVVNDRYRLEIPDTFSPATLETVLQVLTRL